jgi:hypothetical protein
MRKRTLADYILATLAVGIMIGFPVYHWINTHRAPDRTGFFANGSIVARSRR